MKRLFLNQQDFIDSIFKLELEVSSAIPQHFGVEFRGLEEITHNDDDDGEYAGPQFYKLTPSENFPKEFPCVVRILSDDPYVGSPMVISMCIYPSDFKLVP